MDAIFDLLREGIDRRLFPGAAYAFGCEHGTWSGFAGRFTYAMDSPAVGEDALWDVASLTKVAATTPAALLLVQDGRLELDASVGRYLAEFAEGPKSAITVRHLLSHTSGLPAYVATGGPIDSVGLWDRIVAAPLLAEPGAQTVYSCVGFVVLMRTLEQAAGRSFAPFLRERLYGPLQMGDIGFTPSDQARCVPTIALTPERKAVEDALGVVRFREDFVQGSVHDPIALLMGGVSGNAGLFSTVGDLARYCRAVLGLEAGPIDIRMPGAWIRSASSEADFGLGWMTKSVEGSSCGSRFSARSFGHLGYTGTSLWIDPVNRLFAVLLTNRIHPDDRKEGFAAFRPAFHDLAARSLAAR